MGPNSLYCGKWGNISKSHRDLDLGATMPNIKLIVIFIYYNVFKFQVPRSIFLVIVQKHTHMETHTLTNHDTNHTSQELVKIETKNCLEVIR